MNDQGFSKFSGAWTRLLLVCALAVSLPASAGAQASDAAGQGPGSMNDSVGRQVFSNMPSSGVIDKLAELSDKIVLRSQNTPEVRLTFDSKRSMTRSEAIRALESLLFMNGIAVVPLDNQFIKVLPINNLQGQAPTLLDLSELQAAESSERSYAKIYEVEFISSTEAMDLAAQFVSPTARIHELPKLSAIYVNDSLSNLKRVQKLLDTVDRKNEVKQSIEFFSLQNVSANDLLQRLESMKEGPLKGAISSDTVFEADERSNQIVVFTHPENVEFITGLIEQLDIDVAPKTRSELFDIDHAVASEVASLINSIIDEQSSQIEAPQTAQAIEGTNAPQNSGNANDAATPAPAVNTAGPAEPIPNKNRFSTYATVLPDERSNAIIAYGTSDDLAQIERLVDQIDVPLPLVQIDVVITEVTLTDDQARGIDSFNVTLNPNNLLTTTGETDFGIDSASGSRLGSPLSVQGSLDGFSLALIFDTAKRKNNVRVLQAPTITVSHNAKGQINIGERRPVITSSTSDITNTTSIRSQVSYEQIGINLEVTPLIGRNGAIQLEISQEVSSVIDTVNIDGNDQPVIGNRLAMSVVSVNSGETVILGGLQEEAATQTESRIAFFGRIPVVGKLLEGNVSEGNRREIIIFIKPRIVESSAAEKDRIEAAVERSDDREKLRHYFEKGSFNTGLSEDAEADNSAQ
jgi:general secretion pathway protein D